MKDKRNWTMAVACLAAAFVGGAVSNWLLSNQSAFGQDGYYNTEPESEARKVITAQEFRLVGANGEERAALALTPDGRSRLVFTGRNGKRRAYFGLEKDGTPYLLLAGAEGKQRAAIDFQDGQPRLTLTDTNEKVRASLSLGHDEAPGLSFYNHNKRVIWQAP